MNAKRLRQISNVLYAITFFLILYLLFFLFNIVELTHKTKVIITAFSFLSIYFAGIYKCLSLEKNQRTASFKKTVIFIFIFYIFVMLDFTLIDDTLGRNISNIFNLNSSSFSSYVSKNVNLVPFATVRLFINAYKNGHLAFIPVFENLIGNIAAFMPFAFFIPTLFKKIGTAFSFLVIITGVILCVEILQFVFLTGSSDIDDLILNVGGAMMGYGIIKIPMVSKALSRITFGVWKNENDNIKSEC